MEKRKNIKCVIDMSIEEMVIKGLILLFSSWIVIWNWFRKNYK